MAQHDILVADDGRLQWQGKIYRCAVGRNGLTRDKHEGDGATPCGRFALRNVLYRPDRLDLPATDLAVSALRPQDGWCDTPADPHYNQPVHLPYPAPAEALWRADQLYDVLVVLGHNDTPVRPGRGSAIFLHVAGPDYAPTEGCIALARDDLLEVIRACASATHITIG